MIECVNLNNSKGVIGMSATIITLMLEEIISSGTPDDWLDLALNIC